jgi:HSP20 family protein
MRLWDTTQQLDRLWGEMDRLFGETFGGFGALPREGEGRQVLRPAMSVEEADDAFGIAVDLPGVRPEGLDVEIHGGTLRIRAVRDERRAYECRLPLPEPLDRERVRADLRDGVLYLALPKREEGRPRKVAIGAGERTAIEAEPERREPSAAGGT